MIILKEIGQALLNFIYPPLCLSCSSPLLETGILCPSCQAIMAMIDPQERCSFCFSDKIPSQRRLCAKCQKSSAIFNQVAAVFDFAGPAADLIRKLKYGGQDYLAKGLGAYLAAQFINLNWPSPDYIVPVPISFTHLIERGYNQSALLAQSFAECLKYPFKELLLRKSGEYSQAGLSYEQRVHASGEKTIFLKKEIDIKDKTILLIDDVSTTGGTLKKCGEVLAEGYPDRIYALTVCKAIE